MIRIANAPCSWGSLEFDGLQGEPIGYAQMLDELVETGYMGTELGDWGFMPTDPSALRSEMTRRGLTMIGAFVPVALRDKSAHGPGAERALRVARLLANVNGSRGQPLIVLADDNGTIPARTRHAGRITPGLGMSESEWRTFADGASHVARTVRQETGLRTAFHHHCAGNVETPEEISELLDRTDPDLLGLVFDTGHFAYGSGPDGCSLVAEALERFGERIRHVHFKDLDPTVARRAREDGLDYFTALRDGVFCELGRGCVDFESALNWLTDHDYSGWVVVEQDVLPGMGSPKESARRNREFLKSLGV